MNSADISALADSDDLLWDTALEAALELPGSELYPFTLDWDAVRVRDKWFMISTVRETRIVNLKADPLDVRALCDSYTTITPGYHMNKRHWITLAPGSDLTTDLVRELVLGSYLLVVTSLPQYKRPINPQTFAQAAHKSRQWSVTPDQP